MFGSKNHIGLDIGTTSVRAVEIEKKGCRRVLNRIGVSSPPDGTIVNGRVAKPAELTKAIKKAVTDGNCTSKTVFFSVNPLNVVIRYLQLPLMTEDETREALKWELSKNLPFTGKAVFDFQILGSEDGTQQVMIVAAEEAIIEAYCSCIRDAGLIPSVVDIEPLAIARLINSLNKISDSDKGLRNSWDTSTVMLADLGQHYTSLNFFRHKKLYFYRVIPFGGHELESVPYKQNTDVRENPFLKSFVGKFMQEIKRSIQFYEVQNRDQDTAGIVLVGGLAKLRGLDELLEEELNTVVEVLNPVPAFHISPEANSKATAYGHSLSLALGLSMREGSL